MIFATITLALLFSYLTISTLFTLQKARMYPPKKILKQRLGLFGTFSILLFFIAFFLIRFR